MLEARMERPLVDVPINAAHRVAPGLVGATTAYALLLSGVAGARVAGVGEGKTPKRI